MYITVVGYDSLVKCACNAWSDNPSSVCSLVDLLLFMSTNQFELSLYNIVMSSSCGEYVLVLLNISSFLVIVLKFRQSSSNHSKNRPPLYSTFNIIYCII